MSENNPNNDVSSLPESWIKPKLSDVITLEKGRKPKVLENLPSNLAYPYINIEAFEKGIYTQYTDGEGATLSNFGDVLIVWDGARCGLVGKGVNGAVGSTLARLFSSGVNNLYLFYFLQSMFSFINSRPRGVGIPHVDPGLFWNIDFPLAPLSEQRRIVAKIEELFTQLDAAETALKRAKANLERYRQSVLQAASSGQLVEQNPDDEPAEILLKRIEGNHRLRILDNRKADFRKQLDLRIQTSSMVFSPQDVLIDLLLETILDDIKSEVVKPVIEMFFINVNNVTDTDLLIKNYWTWLNTSLDHLRSFNYESKVINAQIKAWDVKGEGWVYKEQLRQNNSFFSNGNFWSSTMLKGIDFKTIKLEGQLYLIDKFINQPVEKEWKQTISLKRKPDIEKLPRLPEGWCWVTTDQLLDFVTSGSRGWAKYYSNSGAIFIRIGNLDHNTIDLDLRDSQKVSLPKTTEGMRTRVLKNDILVSITADVGMIGLVSENIGEAYINQHISLARPVDLINAKYLAWFLASQSGQKQLKDLQRGATKMGLGLNDIKSINVPLPPLQEQNKIVMEIERQLTIAISQYGFLDQSCNRISRLRQSILEESFSGRLVEQNPDDEPASILLQRIQAERQETEKQKAARPKREKKNMTEETKRRSLFETLQTAGKRLTPEELFKRAGFNEESVDEFYEELRQELQIEVDGHVVKPGRIKEERPNQAYIYLSEVKS